MRKSARQYLVSLGRLADPRFRARPAQVSGGEQASGIWDSRLSASAYTVDARPLSHCIYNGRRHTWSTGVTGASALGRSSCMTLALTGFSARRRTTYTTPEIAARRRTTRQATD